LLRMIKRGVLRGIRSAGYDIRHNPYYDSDNKKPRKPRPPVVEVLPVSDIPCPSVALDQSVNPVPAIMRSPEFTSTAAFFGDNPAASRSLVSADTQALLFAIIRNLRAKCVVEIGSYRCGTAEAICRALHANGAGRLYTVDPFGAATVPAIIAWWPAELQSHVRFIASNSADFFMEMEKQELHPDLVFVDGNHDYEFALFDIQCAARRIARGGFICVDNISQAGPFFAAADFLAANPDWTECGTSAAHYDGSKAFDRERTGIHNTDMMIIRAPATLPIGARPTTPGEQPWSSNSVQGLRLTLAPGNGPGLLQVQCVVRGFGATLVEVTGETNTAVEAQSTTVSANFDPPVVLEGKFLRIGVEPWLIWRGSTPLRLLEPPSVY
jgi:predicted O-methyltransferase YrrM